MAKFAKILSVALVLSCVAYVTHAPDFLGWTLTTYQYQAIFLGLLLTASFVLYPAGRSVPGLRWHDCVFILLGLVPNGYVVFFQDAWRLHEVMGITACEVVLGISLCVALLEALRRAFGLALPILLLAFIVHPLVNNHLPGFLSGSGYSLERVFGVIYFPPEGIFGMPLNIAATVIVSFLIFGQFFVASGGGQALTDLALCAVGRVRGGTAKAAVVGSGMFGTLSGSTAANVAVTGTFTIPMMKSSGFSPVFAGGIEAAASNGGQLMPPVMGAVAFVMADFLEVPYIQVCYVAFVPALLYFFCMFMQVEFEAARIGIRGLGDDLLPTLRHTLRGGWVYFIPVAALLYLMFVVKSSPGLSAFLAALSILVVASFTRKTRMGPAKVADALGATGNNVIQVGLSCAMAGIMMASVSLTGMAVLLSGEIVKIAAGNMFVLLVLAAAASFLFGLGMTALPCYIFVVVMVAPALTQMGIPDMAAHLFVFWLAVSSFITPPEGVAFYVAAAIAKTAPMAVGWRSVLLGIGNFIIPFVFIYNTGVLLIGSTGKILSDILFLTLGIIPLTAGIIGYFRGRLGRPSRVLLLGSAFLLFSPGGWFRLLGVGAVALFVVHERFIVLKRDPHAQPDRHSV